MPINYDMANHYRSSDCFQLGWPMRDDGEFFKSAQDAIQVTEANVTISFGQLQNKACLLSTRTVSGEKCSKKDKKVGEIILR